ncbi:hypothetical protein ACTHTG_10545 [Neisseria sp. P0017.S009]
MLIPSRDQGRLKPIQATLLQIFNSLFCHVKAISSAINMMSAKRYTAGFRLSQDFQTACSSEWNGVYFPTVFPAAICRLSILPTRRADKSIFAANLLQQIFSHRAAFDIPL